MQLLSDCSHAHILQLQMCTSSVLLDIRLAVQNLLEGAQAGAIHKIRARVQGPFGGHDLSVAEMDTPQHMVVFVGGVGAPTVLSILKRLALHRDKWHSHSGVARLNPSSCSRRELLGIAGVPVELQLTHLLECVGCIGESRLGA